MVRQLYENIEVDYPGALDVYSKGETLNTVLRQHDNSKRDAVRTLSYKSRDLKRWSNQADRQMQVCGEDQCWECAQDRQA